MAPWLDLVLLFCFFILIRTDLVIQPGVVVQLPQAPLQGGASLQLAAVVLSLETQNPGVRDEIVVFKDQSYRLDHEAQFQSLREALAEEVIGHGATSLLLEADSRVQHGTLVQLYALARQVGLRAVNLAAHPLAEGAE